MPTPAPPRHTACARCSTTWRGLRIDQSQAAAELRASNEGCAASWNSTSAEVVVAHGGSAASKGSTLNWIASYVDGIHASRLLHVVRVVVYSKCGAPTHVSELKDVASNLSASTLEVRVLLQIFDLPEALEVQVEVVVQLGRLVACARRRAFGIDSTA